jgi:hypothetical protein
LNWKGWLFAVGLFVVLAVLFTLNGGFMHGD